MTNRWTHGFAAVMFALAIVFTTNSFANDDVFVDEGDGDFDTMALTPKADAPAAVPTEKPAAVAQKPAAAPAPDTSAVDDELATPTIVDEKTDVAPAPAPVQAKKEAPAPSLPNDDLFNDEDPAAKKAPVAQEEEHVAPVHKDKPAKKVAEHKVVEHKVVEHKEKKHAEKKVAKHSAPKEHKVAHHSVKPAGAKGHFAWTTGNCKLQRAPASEASLGQTSASRKIWVEDVDQEWVKVWNKAGEAAFLSRDCLK